MYRRIASLLVVASALVVVLPRGATAQSAFSGTVKDTSGAVLPGVTVEAASPVLIEKVRSSVSDEQGRYTIVDLRPGAYKLTFTLAGFTSLVRDAIELPSNVTVPINVSLGVGTIEESITVSGLTPLVDVQNAQRTQVIAREVIDALPTTRNMQSVGSIVPGVKLSRPDVGGSQGMEQTYMRTHGADDRHTTVQVDGMMVNSSMGDGNIQAYNDDALAQEVSLQTSALSAEVQSGGVRVNMIPKDGGNLFKWGGFIGGTDHSWQGDNNTDELRARGFRYRNFVQHVQDFNLNAGGPIKKDRLWFFSTVRHVSVDEGVANTFYRTPYEGHQVGDPAIQAQYVRDALVRVTTQLTPKNKISVYGERIWKYKNPELSPNWDPVTASDIRDPKHALYFVGQAKWTSAISSKLLFEMGYSTNIERLTLIYQPGIAQTPFTPAWYSQVAKVDLVTGNVEGAAPDGERGIWPDRKVVVSSLSYVTGSHAIKTGFQWSFGQEGNTRSQNGDLVQNYRNGVPDSVDVFNTPLRNKEYVKRDLGIYGQDSWTLKRLTVNAGLRYDHFNAEIQEWCGGGGRFAPAYCQPRVPNMPNWNNFSPRLSAVYDLFGNARTALKGSVSKYMIPWAGGWAKRYDPFTALSDRRNWSDLNRDGIAQDNEIGPSSNPNFGISTGRTPAADLSREYNVETAVSLQHQLLPRVSVNVAYYHRHFYNQEAQANPLLTASDWTPFAVPNPLGNGETLRLFNLRPAKVQQYSQQLVDFNSSINRTIYDGFEVSFNARLPRAANLFGGWSNDRLMTVACDQFDPNKLRFCDQTGQTFQEYGETSKPPFTNDFKLAGTYPLPWGIGVSAVFMSYAGKGNSYTTNSPFLGVYWVVPATAFPNGQRTRTVVSAPNTLNGGTQQNVAGINLIPPGTKYQKRWNQVDVSVKKTVKFGHREIQGQAAIFNIMNANTVLQEIESFGSSLGQPQNILQARMLRLAVLLNF